MESWPQDARLARSSAMESNSFCSSEDHFYDPENRESYIYDPELTSKAAECVFG